MLSAKNLERVSCSYRIVYYDGYFGRVDQLIQSNMQKPFAGYDYDNGYKAGANDAKWNNLNKKA